MSVSAHKDTFVLDHLPPADEQPDFLFSLPELAFTSPLNCVSKLLDHHLAAGNGERPVFITNKERWSYQQLHDLSCQIAHVLREEGIVPGNRVLIRGANNPMFVACWMAVARMGGVVVATMPLLRAAELTTIADKARVTLALCDQRLSEEMVLATNQSETLSKTLYFDGSGSGEKAELETLMEPHPPSFPPLATSADDPVLIAFTSGTTGSPKGTVHYHRDLLAMNECFPKHILEATEDDIFTGSPPIAFTFGLGALVTFPMSVGACSVLIEAPAPDALLEGISDYGATICCTAPTAWRAMVDLVPNYNVGSLSRCVSAGETLPLPTYEAWLDTTGLQIIDGIGATEMIHIFISARLDQIRPGATGKPIPGYEAALFDDQMNRLPPGETGRLAVKGPTGCRYLDDDRQQLYVQEGWNFTGDAYQMDEDGYFWFQARADDMIISSGYNIAGPEVEQGLLQHESVLECAVIGVPDESRGNITKAFVVLRDGFEPDAAHITLLQDFVKSVIAPYKYPRAIEFCDALPKTETGKIQRFKLRQQERL